MGKSSAVSCIEIANKWLMLDDVFPIYILEAECYVISNGKDYRCYKNTTERGYTCMTWPVGVLPNAGRGTPSVTLQSG